MTNGDKIRNKDDVDMAVFLGKIKADETLGEHKFPRTYLGFLGWLKEEARERGDGV